MTNAKLLILAALLFQSFVTGQDKSVEKENGKDEDEASDLWNKVELSLRKNELKAAEKSLSEIIKLEPDQTMAFYYRGRVRFQNGNIDGSVKDFDRHVGLSPKLKSRQWERGISLYYQKKYEAGAKQFEIYQTYHDNDVENSAWRFLCVARCKSIEEARKNLLPIRNDRRIPMMQIYAMFQGKATPEQVLKAAKELPESEASRNSALFYAHLYVGLLYEVQGKKELALKHVRLAKNHKIAHYMWDVANIHVELRSK